jgi:hypothetical protein
MLKRRAAPLAQPAKRAVTYRGSPAASGPAAGAGSSGGSAAGAQPPPVTNPQSMAGAPAKTEILNSKPLADAKPVPQVQGPAGAARRRALTSPQKPQYQDVILLTSSSDED